MSLICRVHGLSSDPPSYVFWYRDKTMVNYDNDNGVTVDIKHLPGRRIISSPFLLFRVPENSEKTRTKLHFIVNFPLPLPTT